jgi:hypothetical protein
MCFRLRRWALRSTCVGLLLLAAMPVCSSERPISVPFQLIDRLHRTEVRKLVDDPTILRRLPARLFRTDRHTYQYLLDHLPLSSKLSGLLGFGGYRVKELEGGRLHGDDGRGVTGDFWVVYGDSTKRVFLGEGSYDSWFTPKVSGKVVMVVEYKEVPFGSKAAEGPGPTMATRVDVYVRTNRVVGYILDFLGRTADKKLTKLISSAQLTSEKLSSEPRKVWGMMISSGRFAPGELESFRSAIMTPAPAGDASPDRQ